MRCSNRSMVQMHDVLSRWELLLYSSKKILALTTAALLGASRTRRHRRRTQPTQSAHSRNSDNDTTRRPRRQWHRDEIARLMFFAGTRRPSPLTGVQWKSACSGSTPPDPTGDTVPHRLEELQVHHCVTRGVWKSGRCKTGSNGNGRIAIFHW